MAEVTLIKFILLRIFGFSIICNFAESEAYCNPTPGGVKRFGTGCAFRCHCANVNEQCNFKTGACVSRCAFEWTGPGCQYRNIALEEESRHLDNIDPGKFSNLGNDRSLTTCSFTGTPTAKRSIAPWWALWLPNEVTFREFEFLTLDSHLSNFPGFIVTVQKGVSQSDHDRKIYHKGQSCYQHDNSTPPNTTIHVKCTQELVGNQLRLQLANTSTQLVVCDFRVYGGCMDRRWGESCENTCGVCTNLQPCNKPNGSCLNGCEIGYKTTNECKTECDIGTFGKNCTGVCKNCSQSICNKENGTCTFGCSPGYTGEICDQECIARTYGINCQHKCNANCVDVCNKVDGTCLTCEAGWKGDRCTAECDQGTFGLHCNSTCSRNCDNCNKVNGTCLSCKAGWKGDNCTLECDEGTFGKQCNKNCSAFCVDICSKVDGTCSSCKAGWKGSNCTLECDDRTFGTGCISSCSEHCDGVCNKVNGSCFYCQAGWTGDNCKHECEDGKFGNRCHKSCSAHCNGVCNKTDGSCLSCKAGWKGTNCTTVCPDGFFGNACQEKCSANCLGGYSSCEKVYGSCLFGCLPGWTGQQCKEACPSGVWGMYCSNFCGHCQSSHCRSTDGVCKGKCSAGFKQTPHCNKECDVGTYGFDCNKNCSANCGHRCNKVDGICLSCKVGWKGDYCSTASEQTESVTRLQLSGGGIAGTVIAIILLLASSILVTTCVYRRKDRKSLMDTPVSFSNLQTYEEVNKPVTMENSYDSI